MLFFFLSFPPVFTGVFVAPSAHQKQYFSNNVVKRASLNLKREFEISFHRYFSPSNFWWHVFFKESNSCWLIKAKKGLKFCLCCGIFRSIFRTQLNIYKWAFFPKSLQHLAVNYFRKNAVSLMFDWILNVPLARTQALFS